MELIQTFNSTITRFITRQGVALQSEERLSRKLTNFNPNSTIFIPVGSAVVVRHCKLRIFRYRYNALFLMILSLGAYRPSLNSYQMCH